MKRAMRVENSVVVEEVETLPTGVKVITINHSGDSEKVPNAILSRVRCMVELVGMITEN